MIVRSLATALASPFWSRAELHDENPILWHQPIVSRRAAPRRVALTNADRLLLVWSYRVWPNVLGALRIMRPKRIVRWRRQVFHVHWRWRSHRLPRRPRVAKEVRDLERDRFMLKRIARRTAWPLWPARLTMTTMSPGLRVGTRTCSTQARKLFPSGAPPPAHRLGRRTPHPRRGGARVATSPTKGGGK